MDKYLIDAEKVSLSSQNILDITDNQTTILEYSDLHQFETLDQAFGGKPAIALLYQAKENFGHWVAIINYEDSIEFFDPYGLYLDEELDFSLYNKSLHQGKPVKHLTQLIQETNKKLIVNRKRLQRFKKDVNTCGRHTALRIKMRKFSLPQYIKLMSANKCYDADFWATVLTINYSI